MRVLTAWILLAAACARLPQPPELPAPGDSYVLEGGGGLLVIGVLLPYEEPVRLASLLPEEKLRAELDKLESEQTVEEIPEPDVPLEAWEPETSEAGLEPLADALSSKLGVTVVFREILPQERGRVPLVLEPRVTLEQRAREALGKLPRIACEPVSARRDGDRVIARPSCPAELRNLKDELLWSGDPVDGFTCPDPGLNPYAHRLIVRDGGVRRAFRIVDLVGTVERRLLATRRALAGGTYAARMVFEVPHLGRPVAGMRERVAIERKEAEATVTIAATEVVSNEFGTADVRLAVPETVAEGPARLVVGEERFPIEILHGRRVSVVTDRALYRSNDRVHVRVMVHTFPAGRPAGHEALRLRSGNREISLKTSKHGIASTSFRLQDARAGFHKVQARCKQASAKTLFRVEHVELQRFTVALEPAEGSRVRVTARYVNGSPLVGAKVKAGKREGVTDARGEFEFAAQPHVVVKVQDVDGRWLEQVYEAPGPSPAADAPRPGRDSPVDRSRAIVGETIRVRLEQDERNRPLLLDVVREGVLLRTLSAPGDTIELPLDHDLVGVLWLYAYRSTNGERTGRRTRVLVSRDRALTVTAKAERERYRPGETAAVDVAVRDRAGEPTAAVLGYWAVEEGILALQKRWPDGHEEIFDVLEARQDAQVVLGVAKELDDPYTIRHRRTPALKRAARQQRRELFHARLGELRKAFLSIYETIPLTEIMSALTLRERLRWHVQRGELDPELLIDPWGTPLALWHAERDTGFVWVSDGPDLLPGTDDDERATWSAWDLWEDLPGRARAFFTLLNEEGVRASSLFMAFECNHAIGLGGGAGGGFRRRAGRRNLSLGSGSGLSGMPVHVRRESSPTLLFVPEAIVGPDGRARLEVPLSDSITTWRMRLVASAADGATGVGFGSIRVSQPLHVEPWLATRLTVGDEIEVPVSTRNETADPVRARLQLRASDEIEVIGSPDATLEIGPRRTGAHKFRIRARKTGKATLRIDAATETERDAVERVVHIRPHAREVVDVARGTTFGRSLPGRVRLDVYPNALSSLVAGFEGLIREPHGCFEQTSSTLYPMVLALDYLERTGRARPALRARAEKLIEQGYRKLIGYEVRGEPGGFSLFGRAPARPFLTAYGLMEFADMARVHPVDPELIPRVVKYLLSKQGEDGSWSSSFARTAYIARALAVAGEPDAAAIRWLEDHADSIDDAYALALANLAGTRPLRRDLVATGKPAGGTSYGARGRSAEIETTALAVQALWPNAGDLPGRLVALRDERGLFGSTQSTIQALRALLLASDDGARKGPARLTVLDRAGDGPRELASAVISPDALETLRLDLGTTSATAFEVSCERELSYTLSRRRWVDWKQPVEEREGLDLVVRYPRGELAVARTRFIGVTVTNAGGRIARQVTAEIGLPPGCDVDASAVRGAESVERAETAVVIYLADLAPGEAKSFRIPFAPRYALKVRTAPSKAYEYYTPGQAVVVAPGRVVARG